MKKIIKNGIIMISIAILLLTLTACDISKSKDEQDAQTLENGDVKYTKEFGSYIVKEGWIENKESSTKNKFFYLKKGTENERLPNNISINKGTNKYSKDDHMEFRKAIYSQLMSQVSNKEGVTINGSGSTTENDDIMYTFIIESDDSIVKQYYIVGDYEYIFIYESIWNVEDEESVDSVTEQMINSFRWAK